MKKILFIIFLCGFIPAFAADESTNVQTTAEFLAQRYGNSDTQCANDIFYNALVNNSNAVSENDNESVVRTWAQQTMQSGDVLKQVLQCPEITSVSDTTTIHFSPVNYTFPNGRKLNINYSTQPRVLKQHLMLAGKRSLPNSNVSPRLGDMDDPAIYINTEPAWYAIMVVQHGALDNFVGPDKNNTVSLKYINDNIDDIYPHGYWCTSKSAIALDKDTINQVVREVVALDDDSNDYYVAGDVNLEWVMYAEIAADVIMTVATLGGGTVVSGAIKGAQATKQAKNLMKSFKALSKLDDVKAYLNITRKIGRHTDDIAKLEKNIKYAEQYQKALKNGDKVRQAEILKEARKSEKSKKKFTRNS